MDDSRWEIQELMSRILDEEMTDTLRADINLAMDPLPQSPKPFGDRPDFNVPWTDTQVINETESIKAVVEESVSVIKNTHEAKCYDNPEYLQAIHALKALYQRFKLAPEAARIPLQEMVVDQIMENNILLILIKCLDTQLTEEFSGYQSEKNFDQRIRVMVHNTLEFFFYFSDISAVFSRAVTETEDKETSLLKCIKLILDKLMVSHFLGDLTTEMDGLLFIALALSYNLVMYDDSETIRRIQEKKMMESMRPYLFSHKERFKVVPLLFMVYVTQESDAKFYCSNPLVIKYLLDKLNEATKSDNKKASGYKVSELMRAMEKLAALDVNKQLLAEIGTIPVMKDILIRGTCEEIHGSLLILMQLAFNEEVAEEVYKQVLDLIERQLYNHENENVQKAARSLLWFRRKKEDKIEPQIESEQPDVFQTESFVSQLGTNRKHIMISYNWDHQDKVRKLHEYLISKNFEVWYDETCMSTNLLDSMAEAVEKAWVIIICISRKYKLSQNCRLEAEYAQKKRKKIVIVKMENYKPDGWLGIIVGKQKVHDFSSDDLESSCCHLFEGLRRLSTARQDSNMSQRSRLRSSSESYHLPEVAAEHDTLAGMTIPEDSSLGPYANLGDTLAQRDLSYLDHWDEDMVTEWFNKHNIKISGLEPISGKELRLLMRMHKESPNAFYRYLLKKLKFRDLASLVDAMDNL